LTSIGRLGVRRGPIAWTILVLVTSGLALVVWIFLVQRELRTYDLRTGAKPLAVASALVLGIVALLLLPTWPELPQYETILRSAFGVLLAAAFWHTSQAVRRAQSLAGVAPTCSPLRAVILLVIFFIGVFYVQREINRVWNRDLTCSNGSRGLGATSE
jgi:hypothetical protein